MQPNCRFNDILLPGQNWVTDHPATVRGQRVRKRGRRGGALLRLRRRNLRRVSVQSTNKKRLQRLLCILLHIDMA